MIKIIKGHENYSIEVSADRQKTIYLDHWAIRFFAEAGSEGQRQTLIRFLEGGGTLLISYANVFDLIGNKPGKSRNEIRHLFQEIGPRWAPINIWPQEVIRRENLGNINANLPCVDETFLSGLLKEFRDNPQKVTKLNSVFEALDLAGDSTEKLRENFHKSSEDLLLYIKSNRLTQATIPFTKGLQETKNAFNGVLNILFRGSKVPDKNDINDILHTVVPSVYAKYLLLDGYWATQVRQTFGFKNLEVFSKKDISKFLKKIS